MPAPSKEELILAQSHQLAVRHRDVLMAHMKELGLRLNTKKSVLSPLQRTTFLGPFRVIKVTRRCFRALVMWKKPWILSQGPVLGTSCHRKMLMTDASLTGWGAILEGRSSQVLWKDQHLSRQINRLEMLAVFLALKNFLADLRGHHVLVHSDNTSVVSYINHQGGLRSRPLCKLACQILLWFQGKLLSLRVAYIPGAHNIGADILSTPRWWSWYGGSSARHKWICLHLKRRLAVHSGSPSHIQLLSDWTRWCRRGRGFVCMHFPRSLCSQESWREFAGTGFYYFSLPRSGRAEYGSFI